MQEIRKNECRPTRTCKSNIFSGIVCCTDCGAKVYYCISKNCDALQDLFVCSSSLKKGKDACKAHFIRAVVLEQGIAERGELPCQAVQAYLQGRTNEKLSKARSQMLANDYEREQAELRKKTNTLTKATAEQEDQSENVDRFIQQVKKCPYLNKLTPAILNDMINAVYVHASDKNSGHRV